jgi:O-antigen/teichoic acid export membrane protein
MQNNNQADSVAKNTAYYTGALIFQKILAFIYFSLIARFLGVEDTGKYVFALTFTTLFAIFIDLGLGPVLTREIAKAKNRTELYLSNILALKIPLAVVTYVLVVSMINILAYPPITRSLVYISGIIMFLDSFSLTFWAVLRGHQRLKYESLGVIGLQLITVSLGSLVLIFKLGLLALISALLIGSLFNLVLALIMVVKKLKISIIPHYEPEVLKLLFRIGVPFALAGIFSRIYTSLDTVLLSTLAGDAAVGWYSIPIKITLALQFLPMAFMAALFPAMSEYFVSNKEKLAKTFEKAMHYLMIISLPMAAGIIVLAEPIILRVYTAEYLNSILPLRILMVSLFFLFINFPVGYLLNACNKQVTNTVNMGITVLVSVVLNIILIPRFSYIGAAVTSFISTFILFNLGMYWVPRIVDYSRLYLVKSFLKILVASLIMAGVIDYLLNHEMGISWLALVPIGAGIYFVVLWILRGVSKHDIQDVWRSVVKG